MRKILNKYHNSIISHQLKYPQKLKNISQSIKKKLNNNNNKL